MHSSAETEKIVDRLLGLIGREGVSEEYVRFRVLLLKSQTALRDELAGAADDVPFDSSLASAFLANLSEALKEADHQSDDLERLRAAADGEPELLEQLAGRVVSDYDDYLDSLGRRLQIDPVALLFFARAMVAPQVTEAVGRRKRLAAEAPASTSGNCPWCGSPPGLAKLDRDDGRRVLFCTLCGESWEFARSLCPFCRSQAELGRLFVTADDPCWIETCNQCGSYLSTVDERKLPDDQSVIPLVTSTATLYLDLIAQEEGYNGGPPYVALC